MPPGTVAERADEPKFPAIDAHSHLLRTRDPDQLVHDMDTYGVRLIVDMDGFWDGVLQSQIAIFAERHPGRFAHFLRVDVRGIDEPGFSARAEACVLEGATLGAVGIKFSKSLA